MLIKKNRLFTYPVLADFTGDYATGELTAEFEDNSHDDYYSFQCRCSVKRNRDISTLLRDHKCQYSCLVYCHRTMFRELFNSETPLIEIKIQKDLLAHDTHFSINVIATKEINGFRSSLFSSKYEGREIDFDKGSFIAIGPQFKKRFPVLSDEDHKANNSLIDIRKSLNSDIAMRVTWDEKKIIVYLFEEIYKSYVNLKKNNDTLKILAQTIALPAIADILSRISDKNTDEEVIAPHETQWYEFLDDICKKLGYENGLESACDSEFSKLTLAQKILQNPLPLAVSSMEHLLNFNEEEEYDE